MQQFPPALSSGAVSWPLTTNYENLSLLRGSCMSHDDVAPKAGPHIDQVNAAATRVPIDSLAGWAAKTRSFGGVCGGGGQVGTLGACATVFIGHRHSQPAPPPTLLSPFLPRPSRTDSDPFQGERDRREVDSLGSVEPVPLLVPFFPAFAGGLPGRRDEVKRRAAQILCRSLHP